MSSLTKSNVHCYCRLRAGEVDAAVQSVGADTVKVFNPSSKQSSPFFFDKVFNPDVSQYDVYLEFEPLLSDVLNGNHVSIFSLGESGSGKTYTLRGPLENPGLLFRLLEKLLEMNARVGGQVSLSMIEIFENSVNDLLAPRFLSGSAHGRGAGASAASASSGAPPPSSSTPAVTVKAIRDSQEILKSIEAGHAVRATLHTTTQYLQNAHVITTASIEVTDRSGARRRGVINFVDMASSDWIEQRIPPNTLQSSFSSLCECLQLVDSLSPQSLPPPHTSRLTSLLESSMTYNSQIILFYHLLPGVSHAGASLKLMNYHVACQKQFHWTHQVSFLERENQVLQNRIYTLQLENEMLSQQVQAFQMAQQQTQQELQLAQADAAIGAASAAQASASSLADRSGGVPAARRRVKLRTHSYSASARSEGGFPSGGNSGTAPGAPSPPPPPSGVMGSGGASHFAAFPNRPMSVTELQRSLNAMDLSHGVGSFRRAAGNSSSGPSFSGAAPSTPSVRSTVVGVSHSSGPGPLSSRSGVVHSSPGRSQKAKSISLLKSAITPTVRANSVKGRRPGLSNLVAPTVSTSQKKVVRPSAMAVGSAAFATPTPVARKTYTSPFFLVSNKK